VKNNCLNSTGTTYPPFNELGTSADPAQFIGNDLYASAGAALYVDEGTTALTTAAQVNALTDMTVSGTTSTACSTAPSGP
jgi:hypothetical protein